MADIRIASLNVNGARDDVKRMQVYETMKQKQLDVLFLQDSNQHTVMIKMLQIG